MKMTSRGLVWGVVKRAVQESTSLPLAKLDWKAGGRRCFHSRTSRLDLQAVPSPRIKPSRSIALDDPKNSPGHTVFTRPGATQLSVIDAFANGVRPHLPDNVEPGEQRAIVLLASSRHASWLHDTNFMSLFLNAMHPRSGQRLPRGANVHVLAGVVDGLSLPPTGREMRHGFSVLVGKIGSITPDLWSQSPDEGQTIGSDAEPSHLSVILGGPGKTTLTVPLANTLFQTGRRSTLLASEWSFTISSKKPRSFGYKLVRSAEKRHGIINVSRLTNNHKAAIRLPLLPITHPRKILEGLGNILAKVDINGKPAPASQELQANIPRWLEVLRSQFGSGHIPGVGVWALVIPRHLIENVKITPEVMLEIAREKSPKYERTLDGDRLQPAGSKLAFEMSTFMERIAWEASPTIKVVLQHGGHIHRILSGGGEWGAKSRLLSLDPQASYGQESEEDTLERFQKSFYNKDNDDGAIAKPGDYVQFFVEREPVHGPASAKQGIQPGLSHYSPTVSFAVSDPNIRVEENEDGEPLATTGQLVRAAKSLAQVQLDHFGASSTEALYVSRRDVPVTKLDIPGTQVLSFESLRPFGRR